MKKGCFLPAVIIGTIIIATAVYIIQNKFDEWFLKPEKNILITEIEKNWDSDLKYIHNSVQKDSLKALIKFYIDNVKSFDISSTEVIEADEKSFFKELNLAIEDSVISDDEISQLTLLLKKELYEESKSN
jgi:hypothetical protein